MKNLLAKIYFIAVVFCLVSVKLLSQTTLISGQEFKYSECVACGPTNNTYSGPHPFHIDPTFISSDFGPRYLSSGNEYNWHGAIDFNPKMGSINGHKDLGFYLHAPTNVYGSSGKILFVGSKNGPTHSTNPQEGLKVIAFEYNESTASGGVGSKHIFSFLHLFHNKQYDFGECEWVVASSTMNTTKKEAILAPNVAGGKDLLLTFSDSDGSAGDYEYTRGTTTYKGTDEFEALQTLGVLGGSGSGSGVTPHLHLVRFTDPYFGPDYHNDRRYYYSNGRYLGTAGEDFAINPFEIISHISINSYDVTIQHRTNPTTQNGVNTFSPGININYSPSSLTQEFLVRPKFSSGISGDETYSGAFNINKISALLTDGPYDGNPYPRLVEGHDFQSYLDLGGKLLSSNDYPLSLNNSGTSSLYGRFSKPPSVMAKTGIYPLAYREKGTHEYYTSSMDSEPFDDYYFCDFNTRIHTNDVITTATLIESDLPKDSRFKDGEYKIKAEVALVQHTLPTQSSTEHNFILDNFMPFIHKLTVRHNFVNIYNVEREYSDGSSKNDGKIITNFNDTNPGSPNGTNDFYIEIEFSEEMDSPQIIYNGISYSGANSLGVWTFGPIDLTVNQCTAMLKVVGKDKNGNDILNINNLYSAAGNVSIPTRIANGVGPSKWDNYPSISMVGFEEFSTCFLDCVGGFLTNSTSSIKRSPTETCLLADFNFYTEGCNISLENNSLGDIISYFWAFGDGATSVEENPMHIYQEDGFYNVTLQLTDGTETTSYSQVIEISDCSDNGNDNDYIESCIISGATIAQEGQEIILTAEALGLPPFTYSWNSYLDFTIINENTIQITIPDDVPTGTDSYTITCFAEDVFGNAESCDHEIEISDNYPELDLYVFPVPENSILCLTAIFDLLGGDPNDDYIFSYTNDNGDFWSQNFGGDYDLCFGGSSPNDPDPLLAGEYDFCVTMSETGVTTCLEDILWLINEPPPDPPECTNAPVKIEFAESINEDGILEVGEYLSFSLNGGFPNSICSAPCQGDCQYLVLYKIYETESGNYDLIYEPYDDFDPYDDVSTIYSNLVNPTSYLTGEDFIFYTNDGCNPGGRIIQPYIYRFRYCFPEGIISITGTPSEPCPFEITYNYEPPKIVGFDFDCRNVKANIEKGCRQSENINSCDGLQYYQNYVWKTFRYDNPDEEIDELLINGEGYNCALFNKYHSYYSEFPGELFSFYIELTCEDGNGITAYKKQLVNVEKPLHFLVPDLIIRCSAGTSTFVVGESLIAGGSGAYDIEFPDYTHWNGNLNPNFTKNEITTQPINIFVYDGECEIETPVEIEWEDLVLNISDNTITACSSENSSQTLLGNDLDIITGGSGEFTYSWTSSTANGLDYLSDPYELNPTVYAPTQTIYTLSVNDLVSDCNASSQITVNPSTTLIEADAFVGSWTTIERCNGLPFTIGYGWPAPYEITFGTGEEVLIEWTSDNPLFVATNEPFPFLDSYINSLPGVYNYNLKVTDTGNGCFDEDAINIDMKKPILYSGFTSENQYVIPGFTTEAWSGNQTNKVILESENDLSSGVEPLSIEWVDYNGAYNVIGNLTNDVNVELNPSGAQPFTMKIVNGDGCWNSVKTDNFIFLEDLAPTLSAEILNGGMIFCEGDELCFEVSLDLNLYSPPSSLPSSVFVDCTFEFANVGSCPPIFDVLELTLIDGIQGLYSTDFCWTSIDCNQADVLTQMNAIFEIDEPFALITEQPILLLSNTIAYDKCEHVCNSNINDYNYGLNGFHSGGHLFFARVNPVCDDNCTDDMDWPLSEKMLLAQARTPKILMFGNGFSANLNSNLLAFNLDDDICGMNLSNEILENREITLIDDESFEAYPEIKLYPNPNKGVFSVEIAKGYENANLFIANSLGLELLKLNSFAGSTRMEIDLTSYPAGVYYLTLISTENNLTRTLKIIKTEE